MKTTILFVSILALSSCSLIEKESPSGSSLVQQLSPKERKIHECLMRAAGREQCLQETVYESRRAPSASAEAIIADNEWFFSSEERKLEFLDFLKALKRAKHALGDKVGHFVDEKGVSVVGSAFFGFGVQWLAELVVHHHELGLFCAPGVNVQTDAGLEASIEAVRSLSCPTNASYEGGFLSLSAGVSGELIGLPVGLGLAYSFGVDLRALKSKIREARASGKLSAKEVRDDLAYLARALSPTELGSRLGGLDSATLFAYGLNVMGQMVPGAANHGVQIHKGALAKALQHRVSLGARFKELNRSAAFQSFLKRHDLVAVQSFFELLSASLTGCDSVGGAASFELSLSPVKAGLSYSKYKLLFEHPVKDLDDLIVMATPLALLNPFLLTPDNLRMLVQVAKKAAAIPAKVQNGCGFNELLRL